MDKQYAVYGRITLNVGDLQKPFTRHSEHDTMKAALAAALELEKRHPSLWTFAGLNVGPEQRNIEIVP